MKRGENSDHALRVFVREIEPRSFFEPLVPELMPKNSNANQFVTDK